MDQCMITLDDERLKTREAEEVRQGEEVVLIGRQGDEVITMDEIADQLGTINYEIACMIASRVPRVYTSGGAVVSVRNELA
jgi:alanine racemase